MSYNKNMDIFEEPNEIHLEKNGYDFCKNDEADPIWSTTRTDVDEEGPFLFSFDCETVYNFWTDYPEKLTPEQVELFKKWNPTMAALK